MQHHGRYRCITGAPQGEIEVVAGGLRRGTHCEHGHRSRRQRREPGGLLDERDAGRLARDRAGNVPPSEHREGCGHMSDGCHPRVL